MDVPVILMVGGVTGWLASLLVKADVRMGAWASVAVGTAGSLVAFGLAHGLEMPFKTAPDFAVVIVLAALTAAWCVGMTRAALGIFFGWASWR